MAPCTRRQNLKNATLMGPVVPSTNTGTPVHPVSKKKKKNKEVDQPTVTLPHLTIKMPPLVGAVVAAVATGSASVALGKRTLSPEDGHEQGRATSGHATKKRHVKDASTRIYPPPLQLTDEEDVSQSNVLSVRKLKQNDSSDEECMAPLTQAVIQKMELKASYSQVGYLQEDYSQAGYTQEDYSRAGHPWEDYSLAGYSQAQEDYLQVGYSQEDNWQAGHSQEDDWQAGHSQEDYSQVGSYTLFDPEAAGAASKDNGVARAHFKATLVHSEAMPVRSKAIHPHSEAMYGHPDATHSCTEAVHGRSEATCSHSEAMHGRSEATHSRTEAVHSHSKATHSHSEVTHFHSKVTHAGVTHAYSEAMPKALHTCSRAAPAHSVTMPAHSMTMPAHSMTTPSHPEGSQGTHSGSAASNGHHTTPAHSNSCQVLEPIDDHAEVKEHCVAAVALLINVNDSPTLIVDLIDRQLNDNYNYIFPRRSNHRDLFPTQPGVNGTVAYEIPKSMLALV
ncbi:hypothetical protein EDB85DRAFT_1899017 [Lactarius pseudohatsudake]|nr:hypothetical protein EDB85DRAFT_1899017 [Lactarius pseudohatsudake]